MVATDPIMDWLGSGLLKAPNCPALSTTHQATSPALESLHSQGAGGQLATRYVVICSTLAVSVCLGCEGDVQVLKGGSFI